MIITKLYIDLIFFFVRVSLRILRTGYKINYDNRR